MKLEDPQIVDSSSANTVSFSSARTRIAFRRRLCAPPDCGIDLKKERSPAVTKIIDEATRIIREDRITFPLYALQKAGVGDLNSEEEFSDIREAIIQRGLGDPLAACWITEKEPNWLDFIKFANRKDMQLWNHTAVYDCLCDYYIRESKTPS
ncbi:MAG: hypothetical protein ACJ8KF_12500 [Chthoniobacterales bacterium]